MSSQEVFKELLLEGTLCDAVVRAGGVDFRAHRIILSSCSSYFRDLFCRGGPPLPSATASGGQQPPVCGVRDVSPEVMSLVLEFAYTGSASVPENGVLELMAGAKRLGVGGLMEACCRLMEKRLRPHSCISIWRLAAHYGCNELEGKAYRYLLLHCEEVFLSPEFLQLSVDQLVSLIGEDGLNAPEESAVFQAVIRWIGHNPGERRGHIPTLLRKVRLALMPIRTLVESVSREELVRHSLPCLSLVIGTMKTLRESHMERPLGLARLPPRLLLALGGFSNELPADVAPGNEDESNGGRMELYNPRTDRWSPAPRGPVPEFCGCLSLGGALYCVGGCLKDNYLSSVHRLDLESGRWQEVGSMHVARCYVSVAALGGLLYAMGGCDKHQTFNSAERFQPQRNQWSMIAPMRKYRADAGAAALNGKVYICGGFIADEALSTAECYSPEADQWTLITPMDTARTAAGVTAHNNHIYVVGGYDGARHVCSAAAFDPGSGRWAPVAPMAHCRSNFGIAALEGLLYAVGGFQNDVQLCSRVERYDYRSNTWTAVQGLETPCASVSCCVVERVPYFSAYLP
ncbi:kelch-like protein 10 [Menidia menidia]